MTSTDWNAYYEKKSPISALTQYILFSKVARVVSKMCTTTRPSVCELGGGLTTFPKFLERSVLTDFGGYLAVDNCERALELGAYKYRYDDRVRFVKGDVTDDLHSTYGGFDVVLSFGLIEHFEREDQIHIVGEHLKLARKDGIAVISFPTGTLQYRAIRSLMEFGKIWAFHDEVPLSLGEFQSLSASAKIVSAQLLRRLPLTQTLVVLQRDDCD